MRQSNIPGVVGLIDCTHIPIISHGGDNAELLRIETVIFQLTCKQSATMNLNLLMLLFVGTAVPMIVEFFIILIFVRSLNVGN